MAHRSEHAFTLIELLVVMIIIAILMAVAVPTFLAQKRNALATRAKVNIKMVVNTIESCAASNTTGAIKGARNCTDAAVLRQDEPVLDAMGNKFWSGTGNNVFPLPDQIAVADLEGGWGTRMGYSVRTSFFDKSVGYGWVMYWEHHFPDGRVDRGCSPRGASTCKTGTW